MFKKLLNRLKEPSSLAGLSMLATLFGVNPALAGAIADAFAAVAVAGTAPNAGTVIAALGAVLAVGAVLVPEQKPPMLVVRG